MKKYRIIREECTISEKKSKALYKIFKNIHDLFNVFCSRAIFIDSDMGNHYYIAIDENYAEIINWELTNESKLKTSPKINDAVNESELSEILDCALIKNEVNRFIRSYNKDSTYIIHRIMGWQQLFDSYIYREFNTLYQLCSIGYDDKDNINYIRTDLYGWKSNVRMSEQLKILNEYLTATDESFTLPLFAYMLFAKCKSLFSRNDSSFALHICGTSNAELNDEIIKYTSHLNRNFFDFTYTDNMDNGDYSISTDVSGELKIKLNFQNKLQLSGEKFKLKDFPVFLYSSSAAKNNTVQNRINAKTLQADLKSGVSFIFYNLSNNENCFLNIEAPNEIKTDFLQSEYTSFPEHGFQFLIQDYIIYIAKKLSLETLKNNNEFRASILSEIYQEFCVDNYTEECMEKYMKQMLDIVRLDNAYISLLEEKVKKWKRDKFSEIIKKYEMFGKCEGDAWKKFTFEDKKKILLEYNKSIKWASNGCSQNVDKEFAVFRLKELAIKRYRNIIVSNYIHTKRYNPRYFTDLYCEAKKELNVKGAVSEQVKRCSFLLAAMMSFKEYVHEKMSEKYSYIVDGYTENLRQILSKKCFDKSRAEIGKDEALLEFNNFISEQISNGQIRDINSDTDAVIGWLNNSDDELILKNEKNVCVFYKQFLQYLHNKNKYTKLRKTKFVSDVLEYNGIIEKHPAGDTERYDKERTINGKKQRVLVLNYKALKEYDPQK